MHTHTHTVHMHARILTSTNNKQERFTGNASVFSSTSDSLLRKGLELNDFLDGSYNSVDRGFLVAEFVPPAMSGLPSRRTKFGSVSGALATNTDMFKKDGDQFPCVTLEHIEKKLPPCRPKKTDPVILEETHCEELYEQVMNDIELYDQRIDSIPTKDVSRRWPQPPMYCVWDCGQVSSIEIHSRSSKKTGLLLGRMTDSNR